MATSRQHPQEASVLDEPEDPAAIRFPRTLDGERLIAVFTRIVEPIGRALPDTCEVVLHDLSKLPNSIVAIHGNVTGRRVGDPATDLLLKFAIGNRRDEDSVVGYHTRLPDGRELTSSTVIIRDVADTPVAALCINSDVSMWESVKHTAQMMLGEVSGDIPVAPVPAPHGAPHADAPRPESFVRDVDELAALLIDQAVNESGIPIELMRKRHKLEVVRSLKARGIFLLRDAVEQVARSLHVTRFTIYNYLNQISEEGGEDDHLPADAP